MSSNHEHRNIDRALAILAETNAQAQVRAIVRTVDRASVHRAEVERQGLTVRHVYRLLPGLAVEGKLDALLTLANQSWVRSIELDRKVSVMSDEE